MATYGHTFTSGDTLTPTKLNAARTATDIVNADIAAAAAIAHTKLANITAGQVLLGNASNVPTATALSGDVTVNNSGVTAISSGVIVDADVNATAAIALSKLATGALPAAITVASDNLVDGTIVNADINASAAIAGTKIAPAFGGQDITVSTADRSITNTTNHALSFGTNNTTRVTIPAAGGISIATGSPDRIGADFSNNAISTLNFGGPNSGEGNFQLQYDRTIGTFRILGGITGSQSEHMRIDGSGNVGIGTSSPSYRLDIRGGSAGVFNASSDAYIYLGEGTSANEYGFLQWDRTNNLFRIGTDTSGSALVLLTNNAERLCIDSSGNVAIGATSVVSEKFEVVGNIAARSNSATGAAGLYNIINGAARSSFGVDMAAAGGAGVSYVDFHRNVFFRDTNSTYETRLQIKPGGQVRFQPLASDPAGAEAGDVYYNSSTNKLKVYNGSSWVDLH
jgi:hypothetical protein